jgi:hypothetical protein
MATLFNTKIKDTYQSLLKLEDNTILTTTSKNITDGLGNASPLYMSTTKIGIGTNSPLYTVDIAGNLRVTDGSFSLTYTGNYSNGSLINAGTYPSFKLTNAAGEGRVSLNNDGPSGSLSLQANGTTYTYLTGTATGNSGYSYFLSQLGVGTATTLGAKLSIKGSGSTSATTSLLVQNSSAYTLLQVLDNGLVYVGTGFTGLNFSGGNAQIFNDGGSGGVISLAMGGTTYLRVYQPKNASSGITSGEINTIATPIDYGWSSGSASPNLLSFNHSINNTGTYSGTFRGIYYNPNLISLTGTNHIAIQTVTGDVLLTTTSGQVGIGSVYGGWRLNVDGAIRAQRIDLTGSAGPGHVMLRIDDNGTVLRNNTFNINSGNGNAGQSANLAVGNTDTTVARLYVKGSGSTSATSSLLVQNSSGTRGFQVNDDGTIYTSTTAFVNISFALAVTYDISCRGIGGNTGALTLVGQSFGNASATMVKIVYAGSPAGTIGTSLSIASAPMQNGTHIGVDFNGDYTTSVGTPTLIGYNYNPSNYGSANLVAFNSVVGGGYFNTSSRQSSAILQADSTTKGFLPPRMTDAQIRAIASPVNGLVAYNTTIDHLCAYQGGAWVKFNHSPM